MTFREKSSSDEDCSCSDDESCSCNEKRVRIADQNLTLQYKPKSYSMPDLLQMDTFKQSYHKHPNIQFSTRLSTSNMDIKNYLPQKEHKLKKKFTNGLKSLRNIPVLGAKSKAPDIIVYNETNGSTTKIHKGHKLLRPFKNLNIFHSKTPFMRRLTPSSAYLKTASSYFKDVHRCRSEDNLNFTNEDVKLLGTEKPFSRGFKRLESYRRRSLSDGISDITNDTSYLPSSKAIPYRSTNTTGFDDTKTSNYCIPFGRSVFYKLPRYKSNEGVSDCTRNLLSTKSLDFESLA